MASRDRDSENEKEKDILNDQVFTFDVHSSRNLINLDKNTTLTISMVSLNRLLSRIALTGIFCLLSTLVFSQKILVAENSRTLKNFKFCQDDKIILKIKGNDRKIFDEIVGMGDSGIVLNLTGEVPLSQISAIYKENWLIQTIRGLSLLGGLAYLGVDSFNRLINNDSPVILSETVIISASLVGLSFALIPLRYRKAVNTENDKWTLRIIDLDEY
jgi:hypothetical protein